MNDGLIIFCLVLATLLPLFSSTVIIFLGKRVLGPAKSGWGTTLVMGVSLLLSLIALFAWQTGDEPRQAVVWNVPWIPVPGTEAGWLYLGLLADSLTVALMVMVTGISFLVHVYSIGYMAGDKLYERFFAYLSLFTFSMLGIVTANGLMQLFVMWELVGLTSYLLIGFWYEKRGPQLACKKAFVMNRIGDAGFLVGFGILFAQLGAKVLLPAAVGQAGEPANMFPAIEAALAEAGHTLTDPPLWLTIAGIGLFCGAIGKSAQFPLHTWLPDAMEGPTPVSSIVHSATMVAAGVYLTARIYPILTPGAHLFIATIGLITLVMAACMALVMTDIKRVLAYSTLSQLGYMILGLGVGAWTYAVFHLVTHAFFKCCLFQCSGSVIHAAHHQQDMRYYGGLGRKLPHTRNAYAICTLAIAGASIPFTGLALSAFYSKDGIIAGAINYGELMGRLNGWGNLFWLGPVIIAYVTPFYMARSFALTFLGKPRDQHLYDHAHEAPKTMLVPQYVLAVMAIVAGWFFWKEMIVGAEPAMAGVPIQEAAALGRDDSHGMHITHAVLLQGFGWILALGAGLWMYKDGFARAEPIAKLPVVRQLHFWAYNKFGFDGLYDVFAVGVCKLVAVVSACVDKWFVDGLVNLVGYAGRFAARAVGMFDGKVIDGMVNGAASAAHGGGQILRTAQAGRVRGYVLTVFASAVILLLIVVITANVNAAG